MNVESLSDEQRGTLAQLQDITNGGSDVQKEIAVLESVGWDLNRAIEAVLDDQPSTSAPLAPSSSYNPTAATTSWGPSTSAQLEPTPFTPLDVDDSAQTVPLPPPPRNTGAGQAISRVGLQLVTALAYPVTVTFSLIIYILRLLRIPVPRFSSRPFSFSSSVQSLFLGSRRPGVYEDAGTVAERWVHGLEEDLGALTLSRRRAQQNEIAQGHAHDTNAADNGGVLPDFYLGSYEDALNCAKRELRVLCVILISEEHDDVPEFKRTTLVDLRFVERLHAENFVVWGGDVRDREPYSAALKLGATTYPFISFISLQPSRVPGLSNPNQPLLTVLSRHSGPATPPTGPTSTHVLLTHIENKLLPRVRTVFDRVRNEEGARAAERQMREDQDRAFAESERRDRERIMARREAERAAAEQARVAEETRRSVEKKKEYASLWRRYARRNLVPTELEASGGAPSVRIGMRLPNGERVVRKFKESDGMDALYAWAGASFIPASFKTVDDPVEPPPRSEWRIEEEGWGFKLAVAYPRSEVPWVEGRSIGEVDALKGGVQLVVEDIASALTETTGHEDEYLTEEE